MNVASGCVPDNPVKRFKNKKPNNGNRYYKKHLPNYPLHIHCSNIEIEPKVIAYKKGKKNDKKVEKKNDPTWEVAA